MSVVPRSSTPVGMRLIGAILLLASFGPSFSQASDGPPPRNTGSSRSTADEEAEDASKDRARFQGTWKCTQYEFNGKDMPGDPGDPAHNPFWKVIFDGDIYYFVEEDGKPSDPIYKVRWNSSISPKQFDLDGIPKQETLAGIYKLEGDTLRICLTIDKDSPVRPTRFATKEGLPLMLFVFQRDKSIPIRKSGSN